MTPAPDIITPAMIERTHAQRVNALMGLGINYQGWVKATAADVVAAWQSCPTVDDLAETVAKLLMTPSQLIWLVERGMTLNTLLRGQFLDSDLLTVERCFCESWNEQIGTTVFGFTERRRGQPTYEDEEDRDDG